MSLPVTITMEPSHVCIKFVWNGTLISEVVILLKHRMLAARRITVSYILLYMLNTSQDYRIGSQPMKTPNVEFHIEFHSERFSYNQPTCDQCSPTR